jgi:hypothetical protein
MSRMSAGRSESTDSVVPDVIVNDAAGIMSMLALAFAPEESAMPLRFQRAAK